MNTVERFTAKTDFYAAYRWDYEPAVMDVLMEITGLAAGAPTADVGAGTGALTRCLLDAGLRVMAVEPNAGMRRIAESRLGRSPNFVSVDGLADDTGLGAASVALITAGRAIHWFPLAAARREFLRILRPGGWLALFSVNIADEQMTSATRSLQTAENGWETRDNKFTRGGVDKVFLYGGAHFQEVSVPGVRVENWEQFLGRLLSFSHAPNPDNPAYSTFTQAARAVFDRFASDGMVSISVATEMTIGVLHANN